MPIPYEAAPEPIGDSSNSVIIVVKMSDGSQQYITHSAWRTPVQALGTLQSSVARHAAIPVDIVSIDRKHARAVFLNTAHIAQFWPLATL
jgi:hypothetical protein